MKSSKDRKQHIFITDAELAKSEAKSIQMRHLIREIRTNYDYNAIYQRGSNIWPLAMKQNLISSIIAGLPVGWIHVITRPDMRDMYNVCDGKQRWETVDEFIDNKFGFNWNNQLLHFSDLKTSPFDDLYRRFMEYSWDVRLWSEMGVLKERDLFERINAVSSLSASEKIYCSDFFTKALLMHIFDNCLAGIRTRMTKNIADNRRYSGIRWTHNVLHVCFGHDLRGTYTNTPANKKVIIESSRLIDEMFLNYVGEANLTNNMNHHTFITDQMLEDLGLSSNIDLFRRTADLLYEILIFDHGVKQKPDKNALGDLLVFFLNHLRNRTLTASQMREHKADLFQVCKAYIETRSAKENRFSQNQTSKATLAAIHNYLSQLLSATSINTDEKNRTISQSERDAAYAACSGRCPICECVLTEANIQVDHVNAKSKFGDTSFVCLCESCNRRKSDWSSAEFTKYSKYISVFSQPDKRDAA